MARFILKWRYIKTGSSKHSDNLLKYIATREGVEKCDESWKKQPSTVEQNRLIKELVSNFPDSVQSPEYQDYLSAPTKSSASEFIERTIEDNLDRIGRKENYVGYIAKRPRVEKQGTHGLFSQTDRPIDLSAVSKEIAEHEGAVWTTIMSLCREDAELLGYDNAKAWKDMLRSQADKLAKAMGIPLEDLRWYAAFHNEGHHPHIHLISYSVGKEPYMTEQALNTFKSDFANEIFKNELYNVYRDMTEHRNELRKSGRDKIAEIVQQINGSTYENETIVCMLKKLSALLENHKGKMVYGYMPKIAKNLINGIVDELAGDERILKLYDLWYEQKENVIRTYQDTVPRRIPLSANKEFTSIKNAVIRESLNILHDTVTFEDYTEDYNDAYEERTSSKTNRWTDPNDMHCQYIRGKECLNEKSENYDPEEAIRLFRLSAMQGFDMAMYRLGKIYLQGEIADKNISEALRWLWDAENQGNEYAQYLLGKIYLKGEDVDTDYESAEMLFEKSARQGNAQAKYSLAKMHLQGLAQFSSVHTAVRLLTEASAQGNQWAEYQLGKMYLYGQGVGKDYSYAMRLLNSSAERGSEYARHLIDSYRPGSQSGAAAAVLASMRLLSQLSQIIRDDAEKKNSADRTVDRKLLRKIEQKKLAQGQKMS